MSRNNDKCNHSLCPLGGGEGFVEVVFFRWVVFFFGWLFFLFFCLINVSKLKHLSQPGQHGRQLHCLMSPGSGQLYDFLMSECTTGHAHPLPLLPLLLRLLRPASLSVLLQLWSLTVSFRRTEMTKGEVGGREWAWFDGWQAQGGEDGRF